MPKTDDAQVPGSVVNRRYVVVREWVPALSRSVVTLREVHLGGSLLSTAFAEARHKAKWPPLVELVPVPHVVARLPR